LVLKNHSKGNKLNTIIKIVSLILLSVYFYNDYISSYSDNLSNLQFIGLSLIYASVPLISIALIIHFISHENRAKNWKYVAGTVIEVRERHLFFKKYYQIEYQYYVRDISYLNNVYSTRKEWCELGSLMLNRVFRNGNPTTWEGKRVKVYYNESDLWDSVIDRNMTLDTSMLLIPSVNMIIIVLYVSYCLFMK
jgi:hypothetical protein